MAVTTRKAEEESKESLLSQVKQQHEEVAKEVEIDDMPLNTLADYLRYNKKAREINKKLRILRYPIKQCPVELHPTQRVAFHRKDQPKNPLPVYLSDEMIDFKMTLTPGKIYDLPLHVIDYLSQKGTALWEWFENPDGSRETRKAGMDPRFALRTVYQA
jgi:hypothetical protein